MYIDIYRRNNMDKDFYTVDEFANKFVLTPQTVRKWIKKGIIFAAKIGTGPKAHYRIHRTQIDLVYSLNSKEEK